MADLDPEMSAQVYVDWEYRKVWDSYVLGELLVVQLSPFWRGTLKMCSVSSMYYSYSHYLSLCL